MADAPVLIRASFLPDTYQATCTREGIEVRAPDFVVTTMEEKER